LANFRILWLRWPLTCRLKRSHFIGEHLEIAKTSNADNPLPTGARAPSSAAMSESTHTVSTTATGG
jgi:hypothetical protein